MADDSWIVQIGVVDDPTTDGVPSVPTDVYSGDEDGARAAYAEHSAQAAQADYRYVLLRHLGDVVECLGTPPAAG